MSIDTNVIFAVNDGKKKLEHLHHVISTKMPDPICKVAERFIDQWPEKSWTLIDDELNGAGGFSFNIYDNEIIGYHIMRFWSFSSNDDDAKLVLNAFHCIAHILNCDRFIVCHELLPTSGNNLDEIIQNLKNTIGEPASNWDELHKCEIYEKHSWMIIDTNLS